MSLRHDRVSSLRAAIQHGFYDWITAALLFFLSFSVVMTYLNNEDSRTAYLNKYLSPAVMFALGHGLVGAEGSGAESMNRFLRMETRELKPWETPQGITTRALNQFERLHRYMLVTIGWFWRTFGVAWHTIDLASSLFFGIFCVFAYAFFRLGMGRVLSLIATLFIIFSPAMLYIVPQFRDFSKAPFMCAILVLLICIIKHRLRWPVLLLLACILGVLLGLGLGFRHDFLVYVPGAMAAIAVFQPGAWRQSMLKRIIPPLALLAVFLFIGWPALRASRDGANSIHNIVLGLTESFHRRMGLGGAPYEIGHHYRDVYAHTHLSAHSLLEGVDEKPPAYWSSDYEKTGKRYLGRVISYMPADFTLRWYRATDVIFSESPLALDDIKSPFYRINGYLLALLRVRWMLLGCMLEWGRLLAAAAFLALAAINLRWAMAACFLVFYFAGYTNLQFHVRHFFFYEIFFFWAAGFLLHCILQSRRFLNMTVLRPIISTYAAQAFWRWPAIRRMGLMTVTAVVILGGGYATASAIQYFRIRHLYEQYANAPRVALEVNVDQGPMTTFRPRGFLPPESASEREKRFKVQAGILAVALRPGNESVPLHFQYESDNKERDYSKRIVVPGNALNERMWVYFPAYTTIESSFSPGSSFLASFKVESRHANAIEWIGQISEPAKMPLLLTLVLPDDWTRAPTRMRFLGGPSLDYPIALHAFKTNLATHGDFEEWHDGVPLGVQYAGASLRQETDIVYTGKSAVRQLRTPKETPHQNQFSYICETLTPDTGYWIFIRAMNLSGAPAGLSVYRMESRDQGQAWIQTDMVEVAPTDFFREYKLIAQTSAGEQGGALRIILNAPQAGEQGVIWDALRVIQAPSG